MSRISSSNVQLGQNFVLGQETPKVVKESETFVENARKQAFNILAQANLDAQKIINDAQQQAQEIIAKTQEQAYQAGHEQGSEAGFNEAYNKIFTDFSAQLQAMELLASSSFDIKNEIIRSSEKEIVELSLVIAEKIVKTYIELNPAIVLEITKAAIQDLKDKETVNIIVNPALTECLYQFTDELKNQINGLKNVKILEDKTIRPDGVIIESLDTRIDARFCTQIEEISKKLITESINNPVLQDIDNVDELVKHPEEEAVISAIQSIESFETNVPVEDQQEIVNAEIVDEQEPDEVIIQEKKPKKAGRKPKGTSCD